MVPSSCPRLPWATFWRPLQGSQDKAAASLPLQFLKNIQSPACEASRYESGSKLPHSKWANRYSSAATADFFLCTTTSGA